MQIRQGKISLDERGCPYSPEFGDIYASRDGAYEQSRFVFLEGNGLPKRWQGKDRFVILENGFGLGTNFLTTLKAWREDPQKCGRLFYTAIEAFPPAAADLVKYASAHLRSEAAELAERWPVLTPGVHRLSFDGGRVVLDLYLMESALAAKKLSLGFDALYPDGFSPKKNPQMWEPRLLKALCAHARPEATLATWCVAGEVRRALTEAGFEVTKVQGFGHKSQMTVGRFAPKFKHRRSSVPASSLPPPKSVIIVGAGLAGAAVCEELAARNLKVTVIDAGPVAACGASALRWGVFHAQPSGDDNHLFRLSRAGLEFLLQKQCDYPDFLLNDGLFQMARDEEELGKWHKWFREGRPFVFPSSFLRLMNSEEAEQAVGLKPARGGLWHQGAGIAAVSQWVRARLEKSGAALVFNTKVSHFLKDGNQWAAVDEDGRVIAKADAVVVCCAAQSGVVSGVQLPLTRWKGRLSLLCDESLEPLKGAVTGPGYAIHSPDGWYGAGATYESAEGPMTEEEAHEKNLGHIKALFPQIEATCAAGFYAGYRCVAPDRLPVIGRVQPPQSSDGDEHFYLSCAMGSRGTVFCELGAKIIGAQMFGEPIPVEGDLLKAVAPGRFIK